ncbi:non-ribosomal peptide synthetase [Actinoplanes sp. RD1]|uniref:non-ribosomal peptide synthetase n=1 Tax=Actinoplanes sp. RD1 TaxID=3064538 RepID=UPI00274137A9|nr:non-ribosomal peptide synthetase [Actinoplanes sp. RD1]
MQSLVAEHVRRAPRSPAVLDAATGGAVSYDELWRLAGALAGRLREAGVARGDVVALSLPRGVALVAAMLGVARAGAAYLPIDPAAPAARVRDTLAVAGAGVLVAQEDDPRVQVPRRIEVPAEIPATDAGPAEENQPDDPVYVMFTSGSTGVPKGVSVPHRAVHRLVVEPLFCTLRPGDRVANTSNPAFDASTFEIWGALAAGATVVPLPQVTELPIDEWTARLTEWGIGAMFLTTSLFHLIARERPAALRAVGTVVVGGEQLDLAAVRRVLAAGPPGRLVNGYGPTETTTFAAYFDCDPSTLAGRTRIPVGHPLQRTSLHILDEELAPVAAGATGELCIGGPGVALGYLGRPDLTAERFVTHPGTGERLYRSGDLARELPGPIVEVLGRRDRQVKLRGFRIELDEIEAAATATGLVAEAYVAKLGEGSRAVLAAAVVPAGPLSLPGLTAALTARLPAYMVPATWLVLDRVPLGPTGKADRAAIAAALAAQTPAGPDTAGPDTAGPDTAGSDGGDVGTTLRELWREVLGSEPGDDANFLDEGGNSLAAVQLAGRIQARLGVRTEPHDVLLADTFADLAGRIHAGRAVPA